MIDTHGLPMKFEFHVQGRDDAILCDFTEAECGRPLISGKHGSNHRWKAKEVALRIERGSWKIAAVLKDTEATPVEDLL